MAESFQVVPPRLFATKMCIDTHVPSRATERFTLSIWDVLLGLRITIHLCHAEINNMNDSGQLCSGTADEEIVWLDVSIYKILLVYVLNP